MRLRYVRPVRTHDRVSALVRAELARTGMTMTAAARILGHENNWLGQKLRGTRQWSLEDLDLIAARLPGVQLGELFPGTTSVGTTYDTPLPLERSA